MNMVNELAHARIIEGFSEVFGLCGQVRTVIAQMRSRLQSQGFALESSCAEPYLKVAELENAATVLLREYVSWASPLDVTGEGD
jgi:hypothetical protein